MGIIQNAKEIAELIKKYNDQELYQRIVDLRDEIFELREDNLNLREEVRALTASSDISAELEREGNVYYHNTSGGQRLGPFCLACWDYDRKLVSLLLGSKIYDGESTIKCNICVARRSSPAR